MLAQRNEIEIRSGAQPHLPAQEFNNAAASAAHIQPAAAGRNVSAHERFVHLATGLPVGMSGLASSAVGILPVKVEHAKLQDESQPPLLALGKLAG